MEDDDDLILRKYAQSMREGNVPVREQVLEGDFWSS